MQFHAETINQDSEHIKRKNCYLGHQGLGILLERQKKNLEFNNFIIYLIFRNIQKKP